MELTSDVCRDVIRRYAALVARLADELGDRPMVLPTSSWFPDRFQGDRESVQRLLGRMQTHAGMDDIPIVAELWQEDDQLEPAQGGSCSACVPKTSEGVPRVRDEGNRWVVAVPAGELSHPVVLTAGLARSLSLVFLVETVPEGRELEQPLDVTVELAAVALGLGALVLEASYIYAKGCGGPQVARATALSCEELSVAFAAFISMRGERVRSATKALSATQADALREAADWLDGQRDLVRLLRSDPAIVAELPEQSDGPDERELARLAEELRSTRKSAHKPSAPDPEREALRALVDEAFAEAAPARDSIPR